MTRCYFIIKGRATVLFSRDRCHGDENRVTVSVQDTVLYYYYYFFLKPCLGKRTSFFAPPSVPYFFRVTLRFVVVCDFDYSLSSEICFPGNLHASVRKKSDEYFHIHNRFTFGGCGCTAIDIDGLPTWKRFVRQF